MSTFENGITDADYDAYFAEFDAVLATRRQRFVSLVDASRVTEAPTARQRKRIADWQNQAQSSSGPLTLGAALVITNGLVRGAMTALSWIVPQRIPMTTVATYDEAFEWCVAKLATAGQPVEHLRAEHLRAEQRRAARR